MLLERFAASGSPILPVVGDGGEIVGAISFPTVQQALGHRTALAKLVVARDVATPAVSVRGDQSLYFALEKMSQYDCRDLLVVEEEGPQQRVVAVLTGADINAIFDEQILNPPKHEAAPSPLSRILRRWMPKRPADSTKGKETSPPN